MVNFFVGLTTIGKFVIKDNKTRPQQIWVCFNLRTDGKHNTKQTINKSPKSLTSFVISFFKVSNEKSSNFLTVTKDPCLFIYRRCQ